MNNSLNTTSFAPSQTPSQQLQAHEVLNLDDLNMVEYGLPNQPFHGLTYGPGARLLDVSNHAAIFIHGVNPAMQSFIAAGILNTDMPPSIDPTLSAILNDVRAHGTLLHVTILVPNYEPHYQPEGGREFIPLYGVVLKLYLEATWEDAPVRIALYPELVNQQITWCFWMHQMNFYTIGQSQVLAGGVMGSETGSNYGWSVDSDDGGESSIHDAGSVQGS